MVGPKGFFELILFLIFTGIRSLEHHSVSGSSSVQRLSELFAEKMVKYIQQEGLITHYSNYTTRIQNYIRYMYALQTYIVGVD